MRTTDESWTTARLGDLLTDCRYGTSSSGRGFELVPVVGIPHVKNGRVLTDCAPGIGLPESERLSLSLRPGDILFARTNSRELVGCTGIIEAETDAVFASYLVRLRVDESLVDPRYLNRWLNSAAGRRQVERLITPAVCQANVNPTELRRQVRVPLPPLDEQRRIAEVFATWDEAIENTARLLATKRQHVLGLIQEVTCAARAEREIVGHLGEFCAISKGSGLSKEAVRSEGAHPCILYGELYTVYDEVVGNVVSRTDTGGRVVSFGNEVLIPASTTTTGEDLANATALREPGVLLGGDINILKPKRPDVYDAEYLAYYLTHAKKREIVRLAQGSTIVHLYGRDIASLTVELPNLQTQQRAAATFAQARREIDLLAQLERQYEHQRRGLEQRLLAPPDAQRAAS